MWISFNVSSIFVCPKYLATTVTLALLLISVERLNVVGKSSFTNHLASSLNMPIAEKPIKKLLYLDDEQSKKITEKIYSCYSSNIQTMYYLMGYLSILEDAKKWYINV